MSNNKKILFVHKFQGDILQEISEQYIPKLLEILEKDFPHSLTIHTFITVRSEWQKKDPEHHLYVLCPQGSWEKGTVICVSMADFQNIAIYTLEENCTELKTALKETNIINWNCDFFRFAFIHEKHLNIVEEIIKDKNLASNNAQFYRNKFYTIPHKKAALMWSECPSEMYIDSLKEQHAETVNNEWPHRDETSLNYVRNLIRFNYTLGMFTKVKSELVCWIIRSDYGLGLLTTVEKHRKKGYAKVLVNQISRKLGENGFNIGIHVNLHNEPSHNFFRSFGCEPLCEITWILIGSC